jgi:Ca2+-binding RTX toxin-like protein
MLPYSKSAAHIVEEMLMRSLMGPLVVTLCLVALSPTSAQAVTGPCGFETTDPRYFDSADAVDGVIVGTGHFDIFCMDQPSLTVYTMGSDAEGTGDMVRVIASDATIRAHVDPDGNPIPLNENGIPSEGQQTYVQVFSTGVSFIGSPGYDYVGIYAGSAFVDGRAGADVVNLYSPDACSPDTPGCGLGDVTVEGGTGGDTIIDESGLGTIVLRGESGADVLVERFSTSAARAPLAVSRQVTLFGGKSSDRITARHRSDVVRAGRGYDTCRVVRGVNRRGCEVTRIIA